MIIMANYLLKGIDDMKWRRFKADCDLQGITAKEAFLIYIDTTITRINKYPGRYKFRPGKQNEGGEKT